MALVQGRDRRSVPVRSSLLSVVIAVTALVAAVTFAGSLDHLLATPRLYGWNWDAHVTTNGDTGDAEAVARALAGDPRIVGLAAEDTPPMAIGRTEFNALVLRQSVGVIEPVVLEGRVPRGPDEVALGNETMRKVHAHVGSTVTMTVTAIAPKPGAFRVVGRVVVPPHSDTARLGSGAVFDYSGEGRLIPPGVEPPPLTDVEIRFAPGVDRAVAVADVARKLGSDYSVTTPTRPVDLVNFGRVQNLPLILAGILGLLGAATLAHTLMTSIRRRRRELSILKTLGFTPSQVRRAVAWQATAFVVAAVAIGLPLGAAVGRSVWGVFARHLGTVNQPVTPTLPIVLSIVAAIVVANLVAAVPAALAGRMRPAGALRTE
jgi:putative ABC transport system permease protein